MLQICCACASRKRGKCESMETSYIGILFENTEIIQAVRIAVTGAAL
jgi:hypothetical protein